MYVHRIRRQKKPSPRNHRREIPTSVYALAALFSVCALGYVVSDQYLPRGGQIAGAVATTGAATEHRVQFDVWLIPLHLHRGRRYHLA